MFSIPGVFAVLIMWAFPVIRGSMFIVTKDLCEDRVTECLMSSNEHTPVCGTDGITYSSYCQLISKQCKGESVLVNYVGSCIDTSPCTSALRNGPLHEQPTCNPDGTFARIQCHLPSSYCWCVTPSGVRLQNTLTQYKKPNCPPLHPVLHPSTPSPPITLSKREDPPQMASPTPNHHPRWYCSKKNHLQFAKNLVKTFEIEYNRTISSTTTITLESIITWKFNLLDINRDGHLDKREYEGLVRLAEKGVMPKKCARSLPRMCDMIRDMRISLSEWIVCLTNNSTESLGRVTLGRAGGLLSEVGESPEGEGDNGHDDCPVKHLQALKYQQETSQTHLYIPECNQAGLYQSVQCYSGYCWCVNENTGVPITGTFLKGARPDCKTDFRVVRTMKGCGRGKLEDLIEKMIRAMKRRMESDGGHPMVEGAGRGRGSVNVRRNATENATGNETGKDFKKNEEERAATWTFFSLDLNKNKVLQRGKEWKSIRMMLPENRCAKKLPRFCDTNDDQRISLDEWLGCLNIKAPDSALEHVISVTMLPS
ncbi:SPARC-related modular calcium-binding protein 1-like [Fopius arisanus]|uniref:SPARC-related modular calcium-binding protein 1-like n=1 Tax=Fopius arisanus TaxID=64838 RepID=A0A0C9QZR0_9HYME|nr:PREDICTED: SPARC-related modular calcium-binding protein 1-like [Fopius arisanus]